MRINSVNNYNQSFTSFKVTEEGKKDLARKFAKDPEYEQKFVENIIKPLSYTMSDVIYDGGDNVIINPAHNIVYDYVIGNSNIWNNGDSTSITLKYSRSGNYAEDVEIETNDLPEGRIDMSNLDNKFEIAKRVAQRLDVDCLYYEACHKKNNPQATIRYNEDKLERLFKLG